MSNPAVTTRKPREMEQRKKVWAPQNLLETPPPPPGKHYRWVRHELKNQDDTSNVYKRTRQNYEPVRPEELAERDSETLESGKMQGVVREGDLILMKTDNEIVEQREAYFRKLSDTQMQAVNREMDSKSVPAMPFKREHRSLVTVGQPAKEEKSFDE